MRVLLPTQPAYGHFRPLLPLAHALAYHVLRRDQVEGERNG
ncbi:MAG: hypothetical protein ABIP77_05910 [Candidatus Limnocylindrales bacterium]